LQWFARASEPEAVLFIGGDLDQRIAPLSVADRYLSLWDGLLIGIVP
jgi:hypothetical protein